jgi:predicted enzyme related to lactoylglutathione lyase
MTTDTKAALRFYKRGLGWGTRKWEADPTFTLLTNGNVPVGGLTALPDDARRMGAPPSWLPYISTPDVDATVQQAMALGARVLTGPLDAPGAGRFAVLADPQGATFAPFLADAPAPTDPATPRPGDFSWHELVTTDHASAFTFYEALFGWEKTEAMPMPSGATYQLFGFGDYSMGGMYAPAPDSAKAPHWLSYAHVAQADQAAGRIEAMGGTVVSGPMEVPGGDRIAQCIDPQGAAFAVHSLPGAEPLGAAGTATAPRRTPKKRPAKPAKPVRQPAGKKRRPASKRPSR